MFVFIIVQQNSCERKGHNEFYSAAENISVLKSSITYYDYYYYVLAYNVTAIDEIKRYKI